jgi:hypothetical protein
MSPNRLFHGRQLRFPETPRLPDGLEEGPEAERIMEKKTVARQKRNAALPTTSETPMEFVVGHKVLIQEESRLGRPGKFTITAVVESVREGGRSAYCKNLSTGRILLRNRRFVRPYPVADETNSDDSSEDEETALLAVADGAGAKVGQAKSVQFGGAELIPVLPAAGSLAQLTLRLSQRDPGPVVWEPFQSQAGGRF